MSAMTKTIFAQGVAILSARWNREVPPELSAINLEAFLAAGLTAEEYIVGVKRAAAEEEFFPSAKKIIALARPEAPADVRGGEVFQRVLSLRTHHVTVGYRLSLDLVEHECGIAARRAAVAVGVSRLIGLTDDAYPFVLKEFAKAFAAFDDEDRSRAVSGRLLASGTPKSGTIAPPPAERPQLGKPAAIGDVIRSLPFPTSP